jgi:pyruvate/2-oxoglutarate dehydrogenase complex dihydrolipoamide acyltransferase (E2) component
VLRERRREMTETLRSEAWLLLGNWGAADTVGGDLQLADGRLSFTSQASKVAGLFMLGRHLRELEKKVHHPGLAKKLSLRAVLKGDDEPVKVFDVPFDQVERATIPWYYVNRGVILGIRGETYRFSFTRPANTVAPTNKARLKGLVEDFQKGDIGKAWKAALSTKIPQAAEEHRRARLPEPRHAKEQAPARATPAARRRAEELGVDLSQVEGTGSGGRIIVKDVNRA